MEIKNSLHEEVQNELETLKNVEVGSETYKTTVDGLTKLTDRVIELEKLDIERKEKVESREFDDQLKLNQMREEKKDRLLKNVFAVASLIVSSAITIWGTKAAFKFEEEGTITSTMGRGFLNRLLPKK